MIEVTKLSKSFGALDVLKDVSCSIKKGEVISIIGPSGTGKSVFLNCLNGLLEPDSGNILINDVDITSKKTNINLVRKSMGMVYQNFNLFSHLTVLENITLAPIKILKLPKKEAIARAMELLKLVCLTEKASSFPKSLSGGQQQRIAIARALAMNPEFILFDEPTSALDPTMVSEVLAVIRKLASEGLTMIIVTHEMKFACDVSTRVFYMDECGIYEQGTPEQIFSNPSKPKTRAFINKIRSFEYFISSKYFDLYEFNGKLEEFLKKQMFTDKQIGTIELVSEELLYNIIPEGNASFNVQYSEKSNITEITVAYGGEEQNPLEGGNELSLMILKKTVDEILFSHEADKNIIKIKKERN